MKKNKLFIEYDYNFELIGLITEVKEYKLGWIINTALSVELAKQRDIEISFLKEKMFISNFLYKTENSEFRLLKNKAVNNEENVQYLIPELKQFDYLIMIEGEGDSFQTSKMMDNLKSLNDLRYVSQINYEHLKSKENLIF